MTKTNKGRIILIDGNNYAWAAFHAYKQLSYKGNGVAMMYGLPQMLSGLFKEYPYQEMFMVWDGFRSPERLALHPEYKGDRKHKELVDMDDWKNQYKWARRILHTMGIKQICNGEADDMIYKMVQKAIVKGYSDIIIVSNDKDFHQLITKKDSYTIRVYNHKKKLMLETANLNREFGYHPHQTLDFLSLTGDKSDNIPGYPQIGDVRAADFLLRYGTINKFLEDKKAKHNLIDKEKLFQIKTFARQLMNLEAFDAAHGSKYPIKFLFKPQGIIRDKYLNICAKFGLRKMMGNGFLVQFKRYKVTLDE